MNHVGFDISHVGGEEMAGARAGARAWARAYLLVVSIQMTIVIGSAVGLCVGQGMHGISFWYRPTHVGFDISHLEFGEGDELTS